MARWRQAALAVASLAIVIGFGISCGGDGDGVEKTPAIETTAPGPKVTVTPYTETVPTPAPATADGWLTYENQEFGYAIEYPAGTEVTEEFSREVAVESPGPGTILNLPRQEGTNLAEMFVYITVTEATDGCQPRDPVGVSRLNGTEFAHGRIAAGMAMHSWSGDAYMASNGSRCITLNAVLASVSRSAFADPPEEFDRDAAQAEIDAILSTFRWLD